MPTVCLEPLELQSWLEKTFEPWLHQNGMDGVGALPRSRAATAAAEGADLAQYSAKAVSAPTAVPGSAQAGLHNASG